MDRLEIQATELTPYVLFDAAAGIFKIEGYSYPESALMFYTDIVAWFKQYSKTPNPDTVVLFAFNYVNSTSVKFINDLLKMLDALQASGKNASVKWYINQDDEDIEQLGLELKGLHNIPFEIVAKDPEKPKGPPKKFLG